MSEKIINSRVIQKHDTEENWLKAVNFVPKKGELIVYDADATYDHERFKICDGVTLVGNLPFQFDRDEYYGPTKRTANIVTANSLDNTEIAATTEIVANQAGSGTPSPTNVRLISGYDELKLYLESAYDENSEAAVTHTLEDEIYGGEIDWNTGLLTVTYAAFFPTTTDISRYATASNGNPYLQFVLPQRAANNQDVICSHYRTVTGLVADAAARVTAPVGLYFYDPRFTSQATAEQLLTNEAPCIVYRLAEPYTIQLSPSTLLSLKGKNVLWANCGTTTAIFNQSASVKMYSSVGENTDGPMTQKAASDAFVHKDMIVVSETEPASPVEGMLWFDIS